MNAVDNKVYNIFMFMQYKGWYFMSIVMQMIHLKTLKGPAKNAYEDVV